MRVGRQCLPRRAHAAAVLGALVAALAAAAEAPLPPPEAAAEFGAPREARSRTLLIHGSTDIELFEPVLTAFAAARPGLGIVYEQRSTNDISQLADAACAAGGASADLLISSSIDQQIKLVNDGCAEAHRSPATAATPPWANWRDEVFGLTREPAVIVYNRALAPELAALRTRFDLIDVLRPADSRLAGRIATYDIERAGVGYLFAFADAQQATTFGRLVEALGRNRVVTSCCASEILDGVAEGRFLAAYNVLGSYALARARRDPRIAVAAPSDYTLLLSRAALVPRGARNLADAKAFIDFALSARGQQRLAEAFLIVEFDTESDAASALPAPAILRPIPFSPVLLVGLDRLKKDLFLRSWRDSVYPPEASP